MRRPKLKAGLTGRRPRLRTGPVGLNRGPRQPQLNAGFVGTGSSALLGQARATPSRSGSGGLAGGLGKVPPGQIKPQGVLRPGLKYSATGSVVQDLQIGRVTKRSGDLTNRVGPYRVSTPYRRRRRKLTGGLATKWSGLDGGLQ